MVTLSYLLISVVMLHGVHYAYTDDNWDSLLQGTDYRYYICLWRAIELIICQIFSLWKNTCSFWDCN